MMHQTGESIVLPKKSRLFGRYWPCRITVLVNRDVGKAFLNCNDKVLFYRGLVAQGGFLRVVARFSL